MERPAKSAVDGYEVIYADPPWAYNARNVTDRLCGGAMRHYQVMSLEEICSLPIKDIAAKNAMLFMWATCPLLDEAFKVIDAWGFTYCTVGFNWIKLNPVDYGVFFGVGFYTKSNSELCLLAKRGKGIRPAVNTESQVIISPRMEHSKKPDEARLRIERLYPDSSRVELFARQRISGWHAWGNEVEPDLEITTRAY